MPISVSLFSVTGQISLATTLGKYYTRKIMQTSSAIIAEILEIMYVTESYIESNKGNPGSVWDIIIALPLIGVEYLYDLYHYPDLSGIDELHN